MFSDEDLLKYLYKAYTEAKVAGKNTEDFQKIILEGEFYEPLGFDSLLIQNLKERNFRRCFSEEQMRIISTIAHMPPEELDGIFSSAKKDAENFYEKFDEVEQKALSSDNTNLMQQLLPERASIKLNYAVFLANYTRELEGTEIIDASKKAYNYSRELYLEGDETIRKHFNNHFYIEDIAEKNGVLDIGSSKKRTVLAERFFDQEVRKFFDFSNDQQIEELYTLDTKYKDSLLSIKNELLERAKLSTYQEFVRQDFPYFQDDLDILKNIFKQSPFNDNLDFSPEEKHDLRLMDFIKKLHESRGALWEFKQERISLWDMIDILDPSKMDSPIKDYYRDMPPEVKEDIQRIFQFLKENKKDLSEKYKDYEITDQIYLIIKTNLEKKLKERGAPGLPDEYNSIPSGSRCPTCGEELKKLYDLLNKSEIFSSNDLDIITRGFADITSDKNKNYAISARTGEARDLS